MSRSNTGCLSSLSRSCLGRHRVLASRCHAQGHAVGQRGLIISNNCSCQAELAVPQGCLSVWHSSLPSIRRAQGKNLLASLWLRTLAFRPIKWSIAAALLPSSPGANVKGEGKELLHGLAVVYIESATKCVQDIWNADHADVTLCRPRAPSRGARTQSPFEFRRTAEVRLESSCSSTLGI